MHARRIEAVHRLVEDEQLGVAQKTGRDPEALAHSHGVLRHLDTAATQHAHAVERRVDAVSRGRLTSGRKDLQVLAAREMTMKSRFVDDCTDPSERHVAVLRHGVAEERHSAGVGLSQSEKYTNQRGLAGSVRTEIAKGTSSRDKEFDTVDGDVVAEAFGQSMGFNGPLTFARAPRRGVT